MNRHQRRKATGQQRTKQRKYRGQLNAVAVQYENHGCTRCGHTADVGAYLVISQGAKLAPICLPCQTPSDRAIMAGASLMAKPRGSADDRIWFEAHPKEDYRLRRAFPGEVEELINRQHYVDLREMGVTQPYPVDGAKWIYVWQIAPGKRHRMPIATKDGAEPSPEYQARCRSWWAMAGFREPASTLDSMYADNAAAFGPIMSMMKERGQADHDLCDLAVGQFEADQCRRKA